MSFLPLSLASGLSCSTTVILINLAGKNDESEIKGWEKCKRQSRESKGFCVSNDKINHGRSGWKGMLYWSLCILLLRLQTESSSGFHLKRKRASAETIRQEIHIFTRTHTSPDKRTVLCCLWRCVRASAPHPSHTGHSSGWNGPSLCNDNFTVNSQGDWLATLFFTGQFYALVCDRIALHPQWAEASLVGNTRGIIQGIAGGMSFRTVVLLLHPLLCWVSCLQTKIPKSAITKWIIFYQDLGIWELFCHTVMLPF